MVMIVPNSNKCPCYRQHCHHHHSDHGADWEVTVKEQEGANGRESFALRLHLRTLSTVKTLPFTQTEEHVKCALLGLNSIEVAQSEGK